MAKGQLPCPTLLRLLLRYEPDTGRLFWRPRTSALFSDERGREWKRWNGRYAGKEAFLGSTQDGYRQGSINFTNLRAHRVAFAMTYGRWPSEQIDHINGVRSDNRIVNLREATRELNYANSKRRKRRNQTSLYKGVKFEINRAGHKWRAFGGGTVIGWFEAEESAARAYDEFARKKYGDFALLNFP